jgi:uncharacterized protein (DUF885 family)
MIPFRSIIRTTLATLLLAVCAATLPAARALADTAAEDAKLLAFLDAAYEETIARSPETLTSLGIKRDYDKLDDYTDEDARKNLELAEKQLAQMLATFKPEKLGPQARLSYQLFERQVDRQRLALKWQMHRHPATNNGSAAGRIPVFLLNQHRVDNVDDARAYIARVREVERALRETSAALEARAQLGIYAPKFSFQPVIKDARRVIAGAPFDDGADTAVYADFKKKVSALKLTQAQSQELIAQVTDALKGPFLRGYRQFIATVEKLEPRAKGNEGAWSLPDGVAFYSDAVKLSTTTSLSPEDIHRIGLDEVARIRKDMEAIKTRVGFKGSLEELFAEIKTGAQFHFPNTPEGRQAYLKEATAAIDRAMGKAPTLFLRLPKAKLEVRAVEPWRESTASVAFYNRPAPDGSRPGIYYVNLADMGQVLKPQIEAIAYHEGAPGHHFQIAFAQELEGLPRFRRFGLYSAYAEGWGLYAERLGKEMGFYQDSYSDLGRLSLEMWRAIRLVTDTGMHAKRWTREQAIDYFRQNTLLSERDIAKEVERYIANPGQATSYKIGQLEILRLREHAERQLGAKFDVREFHDVVLGNGALPLDVLAEQVNAYVASK